MDKESILKMKELIEMGRQNGKVLPVSEAFKIHPPEDEAHQGKIEYWESKGVLHEV